MRKTVYIPDELAARVDEYLNQQRESEPGLTFSSLVRQDLERRLASQDRPANLDLAGLASVKADGTDGGRQIDEQVKTARKVSLPSLRERVFGQEVPPKDPRALLRLIGMVSKDTPRRVVPLDERQPEDRYTDCER